MNTLSTKKFSFIFLLSISLLFTGCTKTDTPTNAQWGRSEATEIDLTSKIPGRVVNLYIKEGDSVKKGQLIAKIDARDLNAQYNQTVANIDAITAQKEQAKTVTILNDATAKANLAAAQAGLEKANADLSLAENDFKRFSELIDSGAVSQQTYDAYRTKYQVAKATQAQAETAVATAQAKLLQLDVDKASENNIDSKLNQAKAASDQILISLDETEIKAPFDGIITTKYIEAGSIISQGMPVVAIQDPLDNWVNLKVPETDLKKYLLNQKVLLVGRNKDLRISGTIADISQKPEFATYRGTDERDNTDIVTFNVKIQTNSPDIRPGMRFKIFESK